jgi:hypothetical protein
MDNYPDDDDPIVMVPVPRSQLRAVYRALSEPATEQLQPAKQQGLAVQSEELVEASRQGWTASTISQYEADLTHPFARELATYVAKQAPRSVTIRQVRQAFGKGAKIAGANSVLTKTAKRLFGNPSPLSSRQDGTAGTTYSMDLQIAKWWIEATSANPDASGSKERRTDRNAEREAP